MNDIRFFIAHAKSITDDELRDLDRDVRIALNTLANRKPYDVVLGRDFYNERFKAAGSWEAWSSEVATGLRYPDRKPTFTAIVVPERFVGAGTARIVEKACAARRPVFLFEEGRFLPVTAVHCVDRANWRTGWRIVTA